MPWSHYAKLLGVSLRLPECRLCDDGGALALSILTFWLKFCAAATVSDS